MKKNIITFFALIFILFGIGSGVTIYHLLNTTSDLRYLINLHEIEDIRQELSNNFQKTQSYIYSSAPFFAQNRDEIIDSANVLDQTVVRCHGCHHTPEIEAKLLEVDELIQEYQEQLSYLISTVTEGERRSNLQLKLKDQSNVILNQVMGMVNRAADTLNLKTSLAMHKIDESYIILAATLLITFIAALIVARYLVGSITKPIDELHTVVNKIAAGELGYQAKFRGHGEFKPLISTFNAMSTSLALKEETIRASLQKLNQLNIMTLPLHSTHDRSIIFNYLLSSINTLITVEYFGILLPVEANDHFNLNLFDTETGKISRKPIVLPKAEILDIFREAGGQPLQVNGQQENEWPFSVKPIGIKPDKFLVVWMLVKDEVNGALVAINKKDKDFNAEDSGILGILGNNVSVALDNIRLFEDARQHMLELKKTQRQLIEAEKLTALGALAGGVAHDFNNILCGMIGFVALLKRNHDPEEKDFKMLDTIEKAGFRAANLTKQLLTFSRQKVLDHQPIDVNQHIENVAKLLENTISKLIKIKLELGESLPPILSDPAQLEQIVMNLSVNSRDAMPNGGQLIIRSEKITVDQEFCKEHPEAKAGDYIKMSVSDNGEGIDPEILPRIFDPFFTTKEFGKGTGLGLAMVYGIVKSHEGFIIVTNSPGKVTTFSVYLPVTSLRQVRETQPAISDQMLRANILIVDDEELVTSMLAEHLRNLGCRTYLAGNGEEALEMVKQHKDELDVVILDINMPVMDGREAYVNMVKVKPDLKVLVASGYTLNGSSKDIFAKGVHAFIQKPYSLENIDSKIRQVLAES